MPRLKIFVSYSHADADWVERLRIHLAPLLHEGAIELWDDSKLRPGVDWRAEIRAALDSSSVAILLISPDFLASDFIRAEELSPLLESAQKKGATILPIHVNPSLFARTPLERFQSVNSPDEPLSALTPVKREAILTRVAEAVAELSEKSGGVQESLTLDSRAKVRRRIRKELGRDTGHEWRTIRRLAVVAGVSEEVAVEILREEEDIVLGERKKDGARLARLE